MHQALLRSKPSGFSWNAFGDLLQYPPHPTPSPPILPLQSEAQRLVEKLHTLYSSGAVVPLPFLRATDAAPLALLGLEGDATNRASMVGLQRQQQEDQVRAAELRSLGG